MTSPEALSPGVTVGITELQEHYRDVVVVPTGDGGARVTVADVEMPETLMPRRSWVGFVLPYNYDEVQVYGHFVPADLRRADGGPLEGPGLQSGQSWEGRPATKVSRQSARWRPGADSALLKMLKVVDWLGGSR
jgi:hypothetical protein